LLVVIVIIYSLTKQKTNNSGNCSYCSFRSKQ